MLIDEFVGKMKKAASDMGNVYSQMNGRRFNRICNEDSAGRGHDMRYLAISANPDMIADIGIDYYGYLTIDDNPYPIKISEISKIRYRLCEDGDSCIFRFVFGENYLEITLNLDCYDKLDKYERYYVKIDGERLCCVNQSEMKYLMKSFQKRYSVSIDEILEFERTEEGYSVTGGNRYIETMIIPEEYKGEAVTSISDHAFRGCGRLKYIFISRKISKIGCGIFAGCTELKEIKVSDENSIYNSRKDCNAVIETAHKCLVAGCSESDIPVDVREIAPEAFSCCERLKNIVIPYGVVKIGRNAFEYCDNLNNVIIPGSVAEIGDSAFEHCKSLSNVTLMDGIRHIGYKAFASCNNLRNIKIPNSIDDIDASVFRYCYHLDKNEVIYKEMSS